jgi:hypothetical protein
MSSFTVEPAVFFHRASFHVKEKQGQEHKNTKAPETEWVWQRGQGAAERMITFEAQLLSRGNKKLLA